MFRYSFILKMRNYIEGVLLHRNVNSESIILICGHYKTGMCLACPKECRNTVHIIHKCQLYQALPQQKSEGRVPRVCNLGHAASCGERQPTAKFSTPPYFPITKNLIIKWSIVLTRRICFDTTVEYRFKCAYK